MRRVALSALFVAAAASVSTAEESKPVFKPTEIKAPFLEQFTDDWSERWTPSEATKKTPVGGETFSYVGKWEVEDPEAVLIEGDKGLVAKTKASHHAISAPFAQTIDFSEKPLVVQYEVKYQKGGNCGGGYVKLLEDGFQTAGKEFSDQTPWTIMFGPDLTCPGTKVHFIVRHKSPITGEFEEKHLSLPPKPAFEKNTNLYTLVLHPNNTYDVLFNRESHNTGSLLEDFTPSVNPPKEIDDPEDTKPEDWVDTRRIADPDATKPEDWDEDAPYEILDEEAVKPEGWLDTEPEFIDDPDAEKPEEWDDEEDGDWIAPSIRNPKCDEAPGCGEWKRPYKPNPVYKGKWYAPMIDNPAYIGEWAPRKISNPNYFEDLTPVKTLKPIGGVGIELWTMTEDILFDNIYIGHSLEDANSLAQETWQVKKDIEVEAQKAATPDDDEVDAPSEITFKDDPVAFVRQKVLEFVDAARDDPIEAVKSQPEVAGGLAVAAVSFFTILSILLGLIGGQQPPVTKSVKKTDATTADDKAAKAKTDAAPSAPAGGEKTDSTVKKRK